ncbi:MAG TPA: hypothetical protein DCR04_10095 [Flavobacteriales bacterium]|nr:hypothetical protein [Flavobacteriales bacterium]
MHYRTFPNFYTSIPVDPPANEWQPLLNFLAKGLVSFISFRLSINFTAVVVSGINYYELHLSEIIGATLIFWSCIFLLADLMGLEEVESGAGRGILQPIEPSSMSSDETPAPSFLNIIG